MPQPQQTPNPARPAADRAPLAADLGQTRDRLRELGQRYPALDAAVRTATEEVERAKLETDLRPTDRVAREAAQHAERRLEAAILDRDAVTESIERLRKHEAKLAAGLAAFADTSRVENQAAFRVALAARIKGEAPAARAFMALVALDSELVGRQVADLGHLVAEYLSGTYQHSALSSDRSAINAVRGEVARLRELFDRGEVLP